MRKADKYRDPRGHSLRIYDDIYDSPAYNSLSPHDVMAYLALLRELKQYNNGDLSLPLTRAEKCGISHHVTLARSLRALCAVGLIAITRRGGCTKGGQRLATLYRVTDRECYDIPSKFLEAKPATDEWKQVTSVQRGLELINAAEAAVQKASAEKKKTQGHKATSTTSSGVLVSVKNRTPCDTWDKEMGHDMTMEEKPGNSMPERVSTGFSHEKKKPRHTSPHVSPLYIATPTVHLRDTDGIYMRMTTRPAHPFTALSNSCPQALRAV